MEPRNASTVVFQLPLQPSVRRALDLAADAAGASLAAWIAEAAAWMVAVPLAGLEAEAAALVPVAAPATVARILAGAAARLATPTGAARDARTYPTADGREWTAPREWMREPYAAAVAFRLDAALAARLDAAAEECGATRADLIEAAVKWRLAGCADAWNAPRTRRGRRAR